MSDTMVAIWVLPILIALTLALEGGRVACHKARQTYHNRRLAEAARRKGLCGQQHLGRGSHNASSAMPYHH